MIKLPFQYTDIEIKTEYNVWEFFRSILTGERIELEKINTTYYIDRSKESWDSFQDWCRKVIWWGNKRGAYLYGNKNPVPDLEGHH